MSELTEEEINRVIAEFMGDAGFKRMPSNVRNITSGEDGYSWDIKIVPIEFTRSLDSLVPVIKKLNGYACCVNLNIDIPGNYYSVEIKGGGDMGLACEKLTFFSGEGNPALTLATVCARVIKKIKTKRL